VLVARAILIALGLGFAVSVAGGSGSHAAVGRLGGDYPAFYAAGRMVLHGDGAHLDDPARQAAEQRPYYGAERDGGYLPFAYPPAVALAMAPLAELPYRASYVVDVSLMVAALVVALALLRRAVPAAWVEPSVLVAAAVAFFPMFRALGAGQNTALSLLAIAVAWRALERDRPAVAGLALGLLCFKPQLGAVVLLAVLVAAPRRRWRVAVGSLAGVATLWAASAAVAGPGWLGGWWRHAQRFARIDEAVDRTNGISWSGLAHAALGHGVASDVVASVLVAGTLGAVVWTAWVAGRRRDVGLALAVAAPAALLVAPHALFYDAGLLVVPALVVAERLGRRGRWVVAAAWLLGWGHVVAGGLGFTPVALAVVALAVAAASLAGHPVLGGLAAGGEG
jgi:hypothetical protein